MAQILSLNLDEPSQKECEIIKSLDLPPFIIDTLRHFKYWSLFDLDPEFDSFTAGILHDVGKILNTVCYKDTYPLILYEIERSKWCNRLLECETAVIGDLQHPLTSGTLLSRWEVFPTVSATADEEVPYHITDITDIAAFPLELAVDSVSVIAVRYSDH